jgi:hypothetical protein
MSGPTGIGRREFVATVGIAAGTAGTVVGATTVVGAEPRTPEPWGEDALPVTDGSNVLGLAAGASIGGYRVRAVHVARFGAIPVVLETPAGEAFQVDVLRRDADGAVLGIANTATLSVFLVNGGDGRTTTVEQEGLGAMALADALAPREGHAELAATLLTFRDRGRLYPEASYSVPLR